MSQTFTEKYSIGSSTICESPGIIAQFSANDDHSSSTNEPFETSNETNTLSTNSTKRRKSSIESKNLSQCHCHMKSLFFFDVLDLATELLIKYKTFSFVCVCVFSTCHYLGYAFLSLSLSLFYPSFAYSLYPSFLFFYIFSFYTISFK